MTFKDKDAGQGRPTVIDGDMETCWSCHGAVSNRALFCHACGALQAPRGLDHFARLNLPRRFDVPASDLDRQFKGFQRALSPERFAARPPREKALAQGQRAVLEEAYRILKDPVRRARYLIEIETGYAPGSEGPDDEFRDLHADLDAAADVTAVDRIAHLAAREIEGGVAQLTAAFRLGDHASARGVVMRLERAEALAAAARDRRTALAGAAPKAT